MATRGPLPARVYWIRRGVLIAIALLLVLVVGKLLTGGSDGEEPRNTDGAVKLSGTATHSTSAAPTTATASATPNVTGKGIALAAPSGPCDPEKVVVTPVGGARPNTGQVEIVLQVGTSEAACTFTVSPRSVVVKIVSGADQIWSSQECSVLPTQDVVARAAQPAAVSFIWNGHRSDEDCSASSAWAFPGSYHAIAATLGGEPTDTQFELTRPPGVTITRTAKPTVAPTPAGAASGPAGVNAGNPNQP